MPYPAKIDPSTLGAATLAVVEREGWDDWSLRDVAADLGVSPNALYRHVGDRAGLVVEAGASAARQLLDEILRSDDDDPVERLVDMAARYVDFSVRRSAAYEAFVRAKPQPDHPAILAWHECWAVVVEAATAAAPDAGEACGFALWSMLHGRADLTRGPTSLVDPRTGLAESVRALVVGFRAAGPLPSPVPSDEAPHPG